MGRRVVNALDVLGSVNSVKTSVMMAAKQHQAHRNFYPTAAGGVDIAIRRTLHIIVTVDRYEGA